MSMFGEGAPDPTLAARVAALEALLATLSSQIAANASAAGSAVAGVSGQRIQGDAASLLAVDDAIDGSIRRTQQLADQLGGEILKRANETDVLGQRISILEILSLLQAGRIFATKEEGQGSVAEGEPFMVVATGSASITYWRKINGVAVHITDFPTKLAVDEAITGYKRGDREVTQSTIGFSRLVKKDGVYVVIDGVEGFYYWLDRLGRMTGVDFVKNDARPIIIKDRKAVMIETASEDPLLWFDAELGKVDFVDGDRSIARKAQGLMLEILSGNGDMIGGIASSGEFVEPMAATAPVYFTKQVAFGAAMVEHVHVVADGQVRQLTAGPVNCRAPRLLVPGILRYGRDDGLIASVRVAEGPPDYQNATEGHLLNGQSLAGGSVSHTPGTLPLLGSPVSDRVVMFNGSIRPAWGNDPVIDANLASLVPAFESLSSDANLSDTGMTAFGFGLTRESARRALVMAFGRGGTAYQDLKKGTPSYVNMMTGVQRAKDLGSSSIATVQFRQGENDESTARDVYRGYIVEHHDNLTADIAAITGQAKKPLMILQQISKVNSTTQAIIEPSQAQALVGLDPTQPDIILWGPQFLTTYGDVYHSYPAGYNLFGSYAAKAARRHMYEGRPWLPLHMADAKRISNTLFDLFFNGGWLSYGGHILFDINWVLDPGDYGIVARLPGSVTRLTLATRPLLTGDRSIRIQLATAQAGTVQIGTGYFLQAGMTGAGRLTGLRNCIRDNDPEGCAITGQPLHNYAISNMIEVS